jgi:hypothetical protein
MQISGMHFHVDEDVSLVGLLTDHQRQLAPESHSHHNEVDNVHNHSVVVDVSLPEQLTSAWPRLIPILIASAIATILAVWLQQPILVPSRPPTRVRRHEHWRPPLRAPPISL